LGFQYLDDRYTDNAPPDPFKKKETKGRTAYHSEVSRWFGLPRMMYTWGPSIENKKTGGGGLIRGVWNLKLQVL